MLINKNNGTSMIFIRKKIYNNDYMHARSITISNSKKKFSWTYRHIYNICIYAYMLVKSKINGEKNRIIIICHGLLPPSMMGSFVMSHYTRTIIQYTPLNTLLIILLYNYNYNYNYICTTIINIWELHRFYADPTYYTDFEFYL